MIGRKSEFESFLSKLAPGIGTTGIVGSDATREGFHFTEVKAGVRRFPFDDVDIRRIGRIRVGDRQQNGGKDKAEQREAGTGIHLGSGFRGDHGWGILRGSKTLSITQSRRLRNFAVNGSDPGHLS